MKTRKITVFSIASILGAIALTGCGSVDEEPGNAAQAQPAAQAVAVAATEAETASAEQSINAATQGSAAQVVYYDANTNTASYTQEYAPVQQTAVQQSAPVQYAAPAYQAADPTEQAAANNAVAYAGGSGFMIVSSEPVQTSDGSAAYRFGIVPVDNAKAPAWYYVAGQDFAMTEGEWINKNGTVTEEEWDAYQGSAEHRFNAAGQAAGQNAIAASDIIDAMVVSCDFVNYDYDALRYEFKVGVRSMSDPDGKIEYFMAGSDYAVAFGN